MEAEGKHCSVGSNVANMLLLAAELLKEKS